MNRRQFAALALPLASTGLGIPRRWPRVLVQDPELALVLRGGRHFREGRWQSGDIGVDRAGKLRFGTQLPGARCYSLPGRVIAPGFIDVLADNSTNPAATFPVFEKYKVADGVTTALQMHGGSWDCGSYYAVMGGVPHRIHYGVSTFVMAIRSRFRSLAERRKQVEKNLDQGALGVSHSLEYQPAPMGELLVYATLARRYDRPLVLHLRYSDRDRELEGVDEAIAVARQSGARVHIAHLHSTGGTHRMEAALEKIGTANAEGLCLTTCVYPYSYWATYLSSRRFDPGWQERFGLTYGDLRVVGSGECLTAESFARYRRTGALVAVPEGTMPLARTFDRAIREDFCLIGSDGGIQREPRANSHPRGAGCFATAVRHLLDTGMPLERILDKMALMPRSLVPALRERGVLEEGRAADLTVFDAARIRGTATVDNPNQFSAGIELVLVNGRVACQDGMLAERGGVAIRY